LFKKILSLILIAILAISSVGACNAMTLKFDNSGKYGTDYGNKITLTDQNW